MRKNIFSTLFIVGLTSAAFLLTGSYSADLRGPPGVIFAYAGSSCPSHSVSADGTSDLRAGQFANLFAAVGTSYGTADGTHYNRPDLRGKFVRGVDGSASNDPDHGTRTTCNTGGATGNNVGSCQADQVGPHSHSAGVTIYADTGTNPANPTHARGTDGGGSAGTEGVSVNSNGTTETRAINVYAQYCIWY